MSNPTCVLAQRLTQIPMPRIYYQLIEKQVNVKRVKVQSVMELVNGGERTKLATGWDFQNHNHTPCRGTENLATLKSNYGMR